MNLKKIDFITKAHNRMTLLLEFSGKIFFSNFKL
jgi:hypothetical protein